jgi:hypothetical protein
MALKSPHAKVPIRFGAADSPRQVIPIFPCYDMRLRPVIWNWYDAQRTLTPKGPLSRIPIRIEFPIHHKAGECHYLESAV